MRPSTTHAQSNDGVMSKTKILYCCSNCQHETIKWLGQCPNCQDWNTLCEQHVTPARAHTSSKPIELAPLSNHIKNSCTRIVSNIHEWDRVLGGGIMPGSFLLLAGDPGIGKSTLLLHIAYQLTQHHRVLYFSSEESLEQLATRAHRTNTLSENLLCSDNANLDEIIASAITHKPDVLIIDSIQNCFLPDTTTTHGSIYQLREAGFRLMRMAKEHTIAIIATGHVTKDGFVAGPKTLEHMVDGVFYLHGEDKWQARILRSVKNRFGSINEVGFFSMNEDGLQEIPNINQHLLAESSHAPGTAIISTIEGSRPLLVELQALTIASKFGVPQRVITGADHKHVMLIAAIIEKYLPIKLSSHDIFFKVSGGLKIKDCAADLGIACALISSYTQQPLPEKALTLGEISLNGRIKPVNYGDTHVNEAEKFGMHTLLMSHQQKTQTKLATKTFTHMYELAELFSTQEIS